MSVGAKSQIKTTVQTAAANPAWATAAPGEHDQRPTLDLGWLI